MFRPMLAELAPAPFDNERFLFEPKWDGVRCLAYVSHQDVGLIGRYGDDLTNRFPEIVGAFKVATPAVFDGELVVGDGTLSTFNLIQARVQKGKELNIKWASQRYPATLMVFDILQICDAEVTSEPLWKRKISLDRILDDTDRVKHCPFIETEGIRLFTDLAAVGYEGVMAKDRESPYLPGRRSPLWLKVKVSKEITLYAVGITEGKGSRAETFGAMVLASKEGDRFIYRGEVGSGFTFREAALISSMVKDHPSYGFPISARWIEPIKVRVKFLDETPDGKLRHPVYKGLERR